MIKHRIPQRGAVFLIACREWAAALFGIADIILHRLKGKHPTIVSIIPIL